MYLEKSARSLLICRTQFACRRYYERLRSVDVSVGALQHRESECGSLACAGLCERHNVAILIQQMGYHHLLYRHRGFKPHFFDSAAQGFTYA